MREWEPTGLTIDVSDSQWRSRLVEKFIPTSEFVNGRVVSFCDAAVGIALPGGWEPATHWRDSIPGQVYEEIWSDSYHQIKSLLSSTSKAGENLLQTYLHVLADSLIRIRVWDYIALQPDRPQLVLLPVPSELSNRCKKLLHTEGWFAYALGGRGNVTRIFGWLHKKSRGFKDTSHSHHSNSSKGSKILMIVEDGLSQIHIRPALSIANELVNRGIQPIILTSSPQVFSQFSVQNHSVEMIRPTSIIKLVSSLIGDGIPSWIKLKWKLKNIYLKMQLNPTFLSWLNANLFKFVFKHTLLKGGIVHIEEKWPIELVLSLGESAPLAMIGIEWAQEWGTPNIGISPVLIGDRPDNQNFPASLHLVYGEQGAEVMIKNGVEPDSIQVVGSFEFESALHRNFYLDTALIKDMLPNWHPEKFLVVIATEALAKPESELIPVLEVCLNMEDVYIVIKLHPADTILNVSKIINNHFCIKENLKIITDCDVDALLNVASLLLCIQSNVIVRSALMGTPIICPIFSGRKRAINFSENGLTEDCSDQRHLKFQINKLLRDGEYRKLAIENMQKSVKYFAGSADGNSSIYTVDLALETLSISRVKNRERNEK